MNISWFNIGTFSSFLIFPLRLLVGLFLAVAVYRNGRRREALEYRIPPIVWAALVLVEPAVGLFVYWFVNRDAPYSELAGDDV
ncbi:MAG TPA: hypothetical protein VJ901_15715 [Thermoanaerobaculia bacterium]|nr:hypothetical protein [Thermoanaerobaculia bacterium]